MHVLDYLTHTDDRVMHTCTCTQLIGIMKTSYMTCQCGSAYGRPVVVVAVHYFSYGSIIFCLEDGMLYGCVNQ